MHSTRMGTARLLTVSRSIREGGQESVGGGCSGCVCRGGGCIPVCNGADTPPRVNRITDRCKNITLPQTSFAVVKIIVGNVQISVHIGSVYIPNEQFCFLLYQLHQECCQVLNIVCTCGPMTDNLRWPRSKINYKQRH